MEEKKNVYKLTYFTDSFRGRGKTYTFKHTQAIFSTSENGAKMRVRRLGYDRDKFRFIEVKCIRTNVTAKQAHKMNFRYYSIKTVKAE